MPERARVLELLVGDEYERPLHGDQSFNGEQVEMLAERTLDRSLFEHGSIVAADETLFLTVGHTARTPGRRVAETEDIAAVAGDGDTDIGREVLRTLEAEVPILLPK